MSIERSPIEEMIERSIAASRLSSPSPGAEPADLPPPSAPARTPLVLRLWAGAWPKLIAVGLILLAWQITAWTPWRPDYILPGPWAVLGHLRDVVTDATFPQQLLTTLRRAVIGFGAAILIGSFVGIAVSRFLVLRAGIGSLITGLQTMPSIVWFPLAILLFGPTEQAITFVVILGAAPSIANGILSGIDFVPPAFTRLGKVLGARNWSMYRFIVLPAALPAYVQGLTQGWAFAWRSLMAGELLVIIENRPSLGGRLDFALDFGNAGDIISYMIIILILGMFADWLFSSLSTRMRHTRGLTTR